MLRFRGLGFYGLGFQGFGFRVLRFGLRVKQPGKGGHQPIMTVPETSSLGKLLNRKSPIQRSS